MTLKQAERINGLRYEVLDHGGKHVQVQAFDGETWVASCLAKQLKDAIKCVVEKVYHKRAHEVFEEQGWLCALCGERHPLECDHKISRARGQRDDRKSNLRGLCSRCHAKRHGAKVK